MLVLTRKKNEKIVIVVDGREVVITTVDIRGDRVRLGFEADPDIVILRSEVAGKDGNEA